MRGHRIPKAKWPKWIRQYKALKGIHVKTCCKGLEWEEEGGHAHTDPKDPYCGWICAKHTSAVRSGNFLRHELAHLLSPHNSGHDRKWRDNLIAIGGTLKSFPVWIGSLRYTVPTYRKRKNINEWAPVLGKRTR